MAPLCKALEGVETTHEAIAKAIEKLENIEKYIKGMEKEVFIHDIMKLIKGEQ